MKKHWVLKNGFKKIQNKLLYLAMEQTVAIKTMFRKLITTFTEKKKKKKRSRMPLKLLSSSYGGGQNNCLSLKARTWINGLILESKVIVYRYNSRKHYSQFLIRIRIRNLFPMTTIAPEKKIVINVRVLNLFERDFNLYLV